MSTEPTRYLVAVAHGYLFPLTRYPLCGSPSVARTQMRDTINWVMEQAHLKASTSPGGFVPALSDAAQNEQRLKRASEALSKAFRSLKKGVELSLVIK